MVASAMSGRVRPSALQVFDSRVFDPQGSIDKPVDSSMRQRGSGTGAGEVVWSAPSSWEAQK
jgi:hypothetical protein